MTERAKPRWTTGTWKGHANYLCRFCEFKTLDHGAMVLHARAEHPLASEGGERDQKHPLFGVNFETDRAADHAIELHLTAKHFEGVTPTGASGGYTKADVRTAAKSTIEEA